MAKKILVVEDVDDSRSILVVMLQRYCGYETLEAATGVEAVEKRHLTNRILLSWI